MSTLAFPAVLDSSLLATFKSCPEKLRKEHIEHWKPKAASVHLHAGAAFARGIEIARTAFYANGLGDLAARECGRAALAEAYGDFQTDTAKTLDRMLGAYDFYWSHYPLNDDSPPILLPGGKHAIEVNFAEPIPINHPVTDEPLIYCGRMDAILKFAGGNFITDEKTTSSLGPTWSRQWDLRAQFTGYAWGCSKIGIHVDGALVRGVSILKTKYETQQAISYRPEWQIDRWYEEMLDWVGDMIHCWKSNKWRHNLDHACADFGGCAFREACTSKDEGPWLETSFERREWNPLTRVETKL